MKIIYSEKAGLYRINGHPESPERVLKTAELLKNHGFDFVKPSRASEEEILSVHNRRLVSLLKLAPADKMNDEGDTPFFPDVFEAASLSAGAAILAADMAANSESAFSLMRPPGHHADKNTAQGFCYFNNMAVAVKYLFNVSACKKAAILDIDCHHGNGTQEIFIGKKHVLYASLHQSPLYPGTGLMSEQNCINYPLPAGTTAELYLNTLDMILDKIKEFKPDILGVSAGFDTYEKDPITKMGLKKEDYRKIGGRIAGLKLRTFSILEGGYSEDLPELILNYLKGITNAG